ncbi:centrosomal protein CCDC61-like [Venturia canescens]|uniref:centrosomal protein CCDC61-like n=1 Tax=Venturia canescens TaxID=32260 RepID=UPI001C9BD23B|nr:centrosomal protein CCDC61-like [Venturia canescens]
MNELGPNLVTIYAFKGGREYVTRMRVTALRGGSQRNLELSVTDKYTSENWQSSYDTAYIENLTHKTGNYKQFDVFVAMLQSGLLKTSDCVTLDLLTFEDLEMLRARRSESSTPSTMSSKGSNRRYLILTYSVEFDRIHYPLPLEYCGFPDPSILQATIRRLTAENERLRTTGVNKDLQKRVDQLTLVNRQLVEENRALMNGDKGARRLFSAIKTLENDVAKERVSFRTQIQKLRVENASLALKVRQLTELASRRPGDGSPALRRRSTPPPRSSQSRRSMARKGRSRSSSLTRCYKAPSLSPGSSVESLRSRDSSRRRTAKPFHFRAKEIDFGKLESKIQAVQKMLKEGINLN